MQITMKHAHSQENICRGEEEVGPGIQLGVVAATSLKVDKFCYTYSNYIVVNYHP